MCLRVRINKIAAVGLAVLVIAGAAAGGAYAQQTQSASALGNSGPGKGETAIGDLVADAVRASARADVAFIAASELKAKDQPLAAGKISAVDITSLLSYPDDSLAVLSLTGAVLRQALERSVSIYPQPNLGFLQVSGIRFVFDPSQPAGKRITSVTINSVALSDTASYAVATTNSLANGALGYWRVWTQQNVRTRLQNVTVASAVDAFLKANATLDYSNLDRIKALGK